MSIKDLKNETVKNPFIDSVYNNKFSDIKDAAEKTVARKIHERVKIKQEEILSKVIGK